MLSYVRLAPHILFLLGVSMGAVGMIVGVPAAPEPRFMISVLGAMLVVHLVLALGMRVKDRALWALGGRAPQRPAYGWEFVGIVVLVVASLAAVFLDPTNIVTTLVSVVAITYLARSTAPSRRRWFVLPAALAAAGFLVPRDAGLFLMQGDPPFGGRNLIAFSDQLSYLAVVGAVLVYKLDQRRFLPLFAGLTALFVIAAVGFMMPTVQDAVAGAREGAFDPSTGSYDGPLPGWMDGALGPAGTFYLLIVMASLAAGIPLALRMAWRTADKGSFLDAVVGKAIDANAVLITLMVAALAVSHSLGGNFTPVSLVCVTILYLFASNDVPLAGFFARVLVPDEAEA